MPVSYTHLSHKGGGNHGKGLNQAYHTSGRHGARADVADIRTPEGLAVHIAD